jgi:hypothetical protein
VTTSFLQEVKIENRGAAMLASEPPSPDSA